MEECFMTICSDAQLAVLRLLAECGWVSKRALDLLPYSYYHFTKKTKELFDQGHIRKTGKGLSKCYALNPSARNILSDFNEYRFTTELFETNMLLTRHADRAMLRGDAAAALSLASFGVHPDDKPPLPAHCPPTPLVPDESVWRFLYQNTHPHIYPTDKDKQTYTRRLTHINCYYDAVVLKGLVPKVGNQDNEGVNYSRLCGVLMTPSYLLRVYHSRDVAMKFSTTGERNMRSLLLSDAVFSGYLPEEKRGVLVFGDDFIAAEKILERHISGNRAAIPQTIRKKGRFKSEQAAVGTTLGTTNLGTPLFYLPLERRALELLRIMQYPAWQDTFCRFINGTCFGQKNNAAWCHELDDRQVYILACLNLTQIGLLFQNIVRQPQQPVTLVYLDWQHSFFEGLLNRHGGYCDILIKRMTAEYDVSANHTMNEYWEGSICSSG
jgi:hypothetical protein